MSRLDHLAEGLARSVARRTSRRGLLGTLSTLLIGTAGIPLLPVARGANGKGAGDPTTDPNSGQRPPQSTGNPQDPGDPGSCDYWRYCAIDGALCSCCGGSVNGCPPVEPGL